MALRTFRHNPSLGGFGGESLSLLEQESGASEESIHSDAFAQILKELADNAVDACRLDRSPKGKRAQKQMSMRRVRIQIDAETNEGKDVLLVKVSDNGCGMKDIQACVDAFQTSKGHNDKDKSMTSGRYGIGLTLCLLHAQRLVPNSRAAIQSATTTDSHWKVVSCVVDTDHDSVRCFPGAPLPKASAEESGTSISLLVPGGTTAVMAWPRLSEYFARFQLSMGLNCSLEVLAPSLSTVPLQIRPVQEHQGETQEDSPTESTPRKSVEWKDPSQEENLVTPETAAKDKQSRGQKPTTTKDTDTAIILAAQQYLEQPVEASNVAHTTCPIRLKGKKASETPRLEATLVVHGNAEDNPDCEEAVASMVLVRMVNGMPLLDSAEAIACGLVQGVVSKESIWLSVGLDVTYRSRGSNLARVPTYAVKDSDRVIPFLKTNQHGLFEESQGSDDSSSEDDSEDDLELVGNKRRRGKRSRRIFLPADARLGKMLLVVQIHAEPSQLPLPTLCKGRIPQDNAAINQAMEVALKSCLRKLQVSNPSLFLTSHELRLVERNVCFVPLLSNAIASLLHKANSDQARDMSEMINDWEGGESQPRVTDLHKDSQGDGSDSSEEDPVQRMSSQIRRRLQLVLQKPKTLPAKLDSKETEVLESEDGASEDERLTAPSTRLMDSPAASNEDENAYEDLM